jgi:putative salt-induced outer membrane protein YdiY
MNGFGRVGCLALVLTAVTQSMLAERKDDVVVMKNGDRFTGEVKGLERGLLTFKAGYMAASVSLDWNRVERVESENLFIVALADGRRYAGRIQEIASSLSANVAYNGPMNSVQLGSTSQLNSQSKGPNTTRFTFTGEYFRKLSQNWFYTGVFDALKSDQQELNLRTTYGSGLGRRLVQTDSTSIQLLAGLVYTHEDYFPQTEEEPIRNNGESFVGFRASTFHFRTLELSTQTFVYPSLTDTGRVRLSTQSNAQIEVVRDFFWNFNLYENFDSRPPINAPRNDVGVTTGLGWKF